MAGNGSVYVCNLPEGTDESMLAEYFGTIGLLKVGEFSSYEDTLFAFISLLFTLVLLMIDANTFVIY